MDIILRNIDPGILRSIDDMASRQGISRNEYLRKQITAIGIVGEVNDIELRYRQYTDRLLKEVAVLADAVIENTRILREYISMTGYEE